ncbi:MAG: hypothetical protein ACFFCS_27885, partial [Candidatus Hodarchaeota archaeon]
VEEPAPVVEEPVLVEEPELVVEETAPVEDPSIFNNDLVQNAKNLIDEGKLDEAKSAFMQSRDICHEQNWNEGLDYANKMLAEIETKIQGLENMRIVEEAKECINSKKWIDAKNLFKKSREICTSQDWQEGVAYANKMLSDIDAELSKAEPPSELPSESPGPADSQPSDSPEDDFRSPW